MLFFAVIFGRKSMNPGCRCVHPGYDRRARAIDENPMSNSAMLTEAVIPLFSPAAALLLP